MVESGMKALNQQLQNELNSKKKAKAANMDASVENLKSEVDAEVNEMGKREVQPAAATGAVIPSFQKSTNRLIKLYSMPQLESIRDRQSDKLTVILFWANWYPECEELRETLEKIS